MIKKRIMEEQEHEERKLNPNTHFSPEIKNKKENKLKITTIQFYIIVILLFFLIYHFSFSFKQTIPNVQNTQEDNSNSKS